jgi:cbb3-type cytochrome oxidase maturation protein
MDALYLLIPLSVLLVLAIGGLLVWAAMSGQFEHLDEEGRRILDDERSEHAVDRQQETSQSPSG